MFFANAEGIEKRMIERTNEAIRIENLPEIKGVVYADADIVAPFAGKKAALLFLNAGYNVAYGDPNSTRRGLIYKWEYEPYFSVLSGHHAKIKVDDKLYTIEFKKTILPNLNNKNEGFSFKPNRFYRERDGKYWISNENATEIDYQRYLKAMVSLKGQNADLDNYMEKTKGKHTSNFQGFMIRDVLFNNGDTIVLKAKIKDNKIIPLY